jgi:deazaflavin-dependent oxidoreductase (nitroreductase family)
MKGTLQATLRRLTQLTRPIALRSAGKAGSTTSVVHHVGRRSGRAYDTPVVVAEHEDEFLVALPYGGRTDWLKNVLAAGKAEITWRGQRHPVDRPEVIPMAEATRYFGPKEQRLHRRFRVESALRVRRS